MAAQGHRHIFVIDKSAVVFTYLQGSGAYLAAILQLVGAAHHAIGPGHALFYPKQKRHRISEFLRSFFTKTLFYGLVR